MSDSGLLSVDNGVDKVVDADASVVAKEYYADYAKYVLQYRALPNVYDGFKPVQRRIVYIGNQQPRKLMKTAKLSGLCLSLHPHGSDSITGAINKMAHPLNPLPLFTTKGNFGSVNAGASADRYTECYLSEIARMIFCQFVDYAEYEIGEIGEEEPVALPSLIPYALFSGSEGIGVGLSTKVMPLNLLDLIDFYIDYIKKDGKTKKTVKPDFGYVLLENTDLKELTDPCRGTTTTSSIVTQVSDTVFVIEGLYGKSLDAVLNKIDRYGKWITKEMVGFRDVSSTTLKYVFEIYDKSISAEEFKEVLTKATRCNTSFYRIMEENGCAIYASLEYVVSKSLECLNKAIDKKISTELDRSRKQLTLYGVLNACKSAGVFDNVVKMTSEELLDLIVRTTDCSKETAQEIIKKPISYLTKSHSSEEDSLRVQIEELENHDRKQYLISLYKDLRKAVLPIYENKKHTVASGEKIGNPCIKMLNNNRAQVTDGDGEPFSSIVYFISDKGYIYKRTIDSVSEAEIDIETFNEDKIVGLVTDDKKYVEIWTTFPYDDWTGVLVTDLSGVYDGKKIANLREGKDEETVSQVVGLKELDDNSREYLKSRISKTKYVKKRKE